MHNRARTRSALTLVELIVVMVILMALSTMLVPLLSGVGDSAKETATRATMKALREAVLQYYQDLKGIPLPRAAKGTQSATDSTGMPQSLKELQFLPGDNNGNPIQLDANNNSILFNPSTQRGWRGPYMQQASGSFVFTSGNGTAPLDATFQGYGSNGDVAFLDGWGNPIVLQWPAAGSASSDPSLDLMLRVQAVRLVSAGAPTGSGVSVLDTVRLTNGALPLMPTRSTASQPSLANQRGNDLLLFVLAQDLYP